MSDVTDRMQDCARAIEVMLPPHTGFVLLAFDLGEHSPTSRLEYCSNGRREDVIKAMHEFITKTGDPSKWGKHLPNSGS